MFKYNYQKAVSREELQKIQSDVQKAYLTLITKQGAGNDFLGWLKWPFEYDKEEYTRIKAAAKKIQSDSECLVVIGIGGSYLGAKAVLSALSSYFDKGNKKVEIIFAGCNLSANYQYELLEYLRNKEFSINVISKSGTTTEPAIAFNFLKNLLIEKYGEAEANQRIYATTDKARGALKGEANQKGYQTFVIPDDIGGRYSVFTAVGLLPIASAGYDIDELMQGARDSSLAAYSKPYFDNPALLYAATRKVLLDKQKNVEILVTYEPKLSFISEWWKQLFGESEGKDQKGIFPASLVYSTDLHSMGQFVQEGARIMSETVLKVSSSEYDLMLKATKENADGLNYLAGKTLTYVCEQATEGTILAHLDGGVPNAEIEISKIDEYHLGYLLYFFMFSCGVYCYLLGVNPFNQPGVESYKKNMFALLGKPGYEELQKELLARKGN